MSKRRAGDLGIARVQVEIDSLTLKIRYGVYSNSFELAATGGTISQWDGMPPGVEDTVTSDIIVGSFS